MYELNELKRKFNSLNLDSDSEEEMQKKVLIDKFRYLTIHQQEKKQKIKKPIQTDTQKVFPMYRCMRQINPMKMNERLIDLKNVNMKDEINTQFPFQGNSQFELIPEVKEFHKKVMREAFFPPTASSKRPEQFFINKIIYLINRCLALVPYQENVYLRANRISKTNEDNYHPTTDIVKQVSMNTEEEELKEKSQ